MLILRETLVDLIEYKNVNIIKEIEGFIKLKFSRIECIKSRFLRKIFIKEIFI